MRKRLLLLILALYLCISAFPTAHALWEDRSAEEAGDGPALYAETEAAMLMRYNSIG